ncbi:porin family protein [Myroides sp. DF42-4-2]|uniref:porin family protein n=1 Tax=unclassified Myroides TaxID=2642485 RepID=UPI002576A172|nr:porin family protein [Myroides sp. DF42-4-2]MDM1407081.1 PorT family protein [Myroides sp. DF42-4-2]
MKKITMSLLAIFATSGVAFAQTPDVKIGAKAGLNVTSVTNIDESKSKTGFHVGAVAEIFINEKFAVQPEVLYSTQGVKGPYSFKASFDYINVPIMAKYYVIDGLSLQAGPQVGFLVKAEEEEKISGIKESQDIKDYAKKVDFGLNFGVGYELPMGVFADLRYNLGLSKLDKDGEGSSKNSVFQLSVGYKF